MPMLPNDHHPGPRCSCRECLVTFPLSEFTDRAPAPKGWPTEAELTVDERGKTALKFVRLLSWAVAQGTQSDELSPKRQSLPARHLQRCAGQ